MNDPIEQPSAEANTRSGASVGPDTKVAVPTPLLCVITDETRTEDEIRTAVHAVCANGCRWIQLRHRHLADRALIDLARSLRDITHAHGARLIVNDRVDVALASNADGLHLPAAGLMPADARRLLGPYRLLGRSVHDSRETTGLAVEPVDYFQFGPVFETPSKAAFGPPRGTECLFAAVRAASPKPVVAVGGIDAQRIAAVLATGAGGVAVIRAVSGVSDPGHATAALLNALASR